MSRFNNNVGVRSATNFISSWDEHFVSLGKPYRVYKFRKISGIVRMTNYGEKSLNFNPDNFSQNVSIYTSKEPIVVVWDGSISLSVDEKDNLLEEANVGTYYDLYGNSNFSIENTNEDLSLLTSSYNSQFLSKSISLTSKDWIPSDSDILDCLYLILDHRGKSYQWLEITSSTPNYNEETQDLESVELDFASINLKYASSGKNILDFIQFGSIGSGYAFPEEQIVELEEGKKELKTFVNENLRLDIGINSIQFDYFSGAATSSYAFYGRKVIEDTMVKIKKIDKTQRLFIYKELPPLNSNLFFNQSNTNSFYVEGAKPSTKAVWASYKNNPNASMGGYNVTETKEVMCGLTTTDGVVLASNSIVGGEYTYENWTSSKILTLKNSYELEWVVGFKNVKANSDTQVDTAMFYNFNSYVNFSSDVFNYESEETTKYKLADTFGVLGSVIDILVGGLDIGWTLNEAKAPKQPMNLIFPCVSYLMGMAALQENAPLPMDVFIDDKSKTVLPVATNIMTSHRFSFTDLVRDTSQTTNLGEGKGGNGVWNTKYIGQKTFEDGTYINADKSFFELNLQTTTVLPPSNSQQLWVIDAMTSHVISSSDMRLTAFKSFNYQTEDYKEEQVFTSLTTTIAKALGDIRYWGTTIKYSYYDRYNTSGTAKWPITVKPPSKLDLPEVLHPIIHSELAETYWLTIPAHKLWKADHIWNFTQKKGPFTAIAESQIKHMGSYDRMMHNSKVTIKASNNIVETPDIINIKSLKEIDRVEIEFDEAIKIGGYNPDISRTNTFYTIHIPEIVDDNYYSDTPHPVHTQHISSYRQHVLYQYGVFPLVLYENFFRDVITDGVWISGSVTLSRSALGVVSIKFDVDAGNYELVDVEWGHTIGSLGYFVENKHKIEYTFYPMKVRIYKRKETPVIK